MRGCGDDGDNAKWRTRSNRESGRDSVMTIDDGRGDYRGDDGTEMMATTIDDDPENPIDLSV